MKKFRKLYHNTKARAAAVGTLAMVTAGSAFASGGNTTGILSVIDEYKEEAVVVIIAYLVARWALKATGLLAPK